jgi:dihydrofolate synthase / folylpolyglutamate synthase
MNYPDSVRFLYALGNEIKTAKLGLERIGTLLAALHHPERACPFLHIAGTNGKGSTAAMLEAGFRAAGVRTGLYTSPHLIEPTERIRIAGTPVSPDQFTAAFELVHSTAEQLLDSGQIDLHPTYFETVTAMAFLLFRDLGAERVVLEVGLGGRLDATNVVTPELCLITNIDYDHEQYLGNTIEAIASEKAGILKPGVPAVIARQRPEAERVLNERAAVLRCPVTRAADAPVQEVEIHATGSRFKLAGQLVVCPLAGAHQLENAVTAALALTHLNIPLAGIAQTVWPGRMERVAVSPDIVLDGAHNPAGARALAEHIRTFYPDRRVWLIYGSMRDKAVDEIASTLFPLAYRIVAAAPQFGRALRPEALRDLWPQENIEFAPGVEAALALVRRQAAPADAIFVTGSLFVVGEARAVLVQ